MEPTFSWVPLVLIILSTLTLLISQNWRWSIIAFAVQYVGVFWMISWEWSLGMSAVKLITGWMAGAVLGVSQPGSALAETGFTRLSGSGFKFVTAALIWVLAFAISPSLQVYFPTSTNYLLGAIILIGMGLLQLGMSHQPLRVILGLFTTLSGFELLYAAVDSSVLVAGLVSGVNLGLALVGAFLLINPEPEVPE
ncbi:hypothetical protein FDZ74_09280 [bacterium]|nr:MAG: hypothetical protein FDZ74_09280 [bacterium]